MRFVSIKYLWKSESDRNAGGGQHLSVILRVEFVVSDCLEGRNCGAEFNLKKLNIHKVVCGSWSRGTGSYPIKGFSFILSQPISCPSQDSLLSHTASLSYPQNLSDRVPNFVFLGENLEWKWIFLL